VEERPRRLAALMATALVGLATACGSGSGGPVPPTVTPGSVLDSAASSSAASSSAASTPAATGSTSAPPAGPVHATFIGDSVAQSLHYLPAARRMLGRGMEMRFDLAVCRRLVQRSCTVLGETPPTALEVVRHSGDRLGSVLIVDVGYNDASSTYRDDMEAVLRAARRAGVRGVVWVTLREAGGSYRWINHVIRSEAAAAPNVLVADWNAASAGKPWFKPDGMHLNDQGAEHLATFLRPYVLQAAGKTS
jgi:hypothetical protein